MDCAVVVRLAGGEREAQRPGFLPEEPSAGPAREREDEEVQFVDEAVGEHGPDERPAAADVEVAPTSALSRRIASGVYGPRTSMFLQVGSVSVEETTYFGVSLKNGAPGSSSAVRFDQAGSNIS